MCENNIESILNQFRALHVGNLKDVYSHYSDKIEFDENFTSYKELCNKLNEELKQNIELNNRNKTSVFLSHSHKNLKYAYCVALFLTRKYGVNVYIDEFDSFMPSITSPQTAKRLISKIKRSNRFIFIGTEESFDSKWCNWEVGLGNPKRSKGHLAFFVMNDRIEKNGGYDKNEYVGLYPFIWDKKVLDIESDENDLFVGYYKDRGNWDLFVPLKDWLCKNDNFFNAVQKNKRE